MLSNDDIAKSYENHDIDFSDLFFDGSASLQSNTIAHEISHPNDIGGTNDFNPDGDVQKYYGPDGVKKFGKDFPDKTLEHADTYSQYIEDAFKNKK